MKNKDISILIPTIARPELLLNQLNFYNKFSVDFNIIICDSTPEPDDLFLKKIKLLSKSLSINYFHKPNLNDRQAGLFLVSSCKTIYSAFIGDDDFFIPEGLTKSCLFLEKNSEYRIAYGSSIIVDHNSLCNKKSRLIAYEYWGKTCFNQNNMIERISARLKNNFITVFTVHRTKELFEDYRKCENLPSRILAETFVDFATLARGKAKYIEVPFLIRRQHQKRYLMPFHLVDSLIDDSIGETLPTFRNLFTNLIVESGRTINESEQISKKFIKSILFNYFKKSYSLEKPRLQNKIIYKYLIGIYLRLKNLFFKKSIYFKGFKSYLSIIKSI